MPDRHWYVRLGGKIMAIWAPTPRKALILALQNVTDAGFADLPRSERNQRVTLSVSALDPLGDKS